MNYFGIAQTRTPRPARRKIDHHQLVRCHRALLGVGGFREHFISFSLGRWLLPQPVCGALAGIVQNRNRLTLSYHGLFHSWHARAAGGACVRHIPQDAVPLRTGTSEARLGSAPVELAHSWRQTRNVGCSRWLACNAGR